MNELTSSSLMRVVQVHLAYCSFVPNFDGGSFGTFIPIFKGKRLVIPRIQRLKKRNFFAFELYKWCINDSIVVIKIH